MAIVLRVLERTCVAAAVVSLIVAIAGATTGNAAVWQPAAVATAVCTAVALGMAPTLQTFRFTAWVVAAVVTAILYPQLFQPYATDTPEYKWLLLLLIQAVMFGMGTQITLRDFAGVAKQPWPVAIGIICQFTIMPLVGYSLALAFRLPAEIAAGMVLIGSCSSGLSSNVMVYLARANLALSITLTAVATVLAPIMTPFWMKTLASGLLAGTTVNVEFFPLMASIIKIVVVPIGAALVHDFLLHSSSFGERLIRTVAALGAVALVISFGGVWPGFIASLSGDRAMAFELLLFLLGGILFGVIYHEAVKRKAWLERLMPAVAMVGIVYVTGMTTAEGRENLLVVGVALVAAAALHNVLGYILGYGLGRLMGLDIQSSRTVAFEVGLQNGGMATGIAADMGKLGTLGLPAAFFIAWMNVSGSVLANFWRRRPTTHQDSAPEETATLN